MVRKQYRLKSVPASQSLFIALRPSKVNSFNRSVRPMILLIGFCGGSTQLEVTNAQAGFTDLVLICVLDLQDVYRADVWASSLDNPSGLNGSTVHGGQTHATAQLLCRYELLPAYDTVDHLRLSPAGYQAMADAIDLKLFIP